MPFCRCFSFAFAFTLIVAIAHAQQAAYLDQKFSPAERAHDLVSRMTLDEKAAQLED